MVIYTNTNASTGSPSVASPAASGTQVGAFPGSAGFLPWQPSKWPKPPGNFDEGFAETLRKIFHESILDEIKNIIEDAEAANGDLQHRCHVVAIAMLCAVDALSSYGFENVKSVKCKTCGRGDRVGPRYEKFIASFFGRDYRPHAKILYTLYRNSMVHSWNLFGATILPGDEPVRKDKSGVLSFGIKNFFGALCQGADNFLIGLKTQPDLQRSALSRYKELRQKAR